MEPRRAETETTVHRVRSQLESLLANIELSKLDWVTLTLDLVLDEFTLLDQCLKYGWKNGVSRRSACLLWQLDFLTAHHVEVLACIVVELSHGECLRLRTVVVLAVAPVDGREAQAVLLDDAWIQTVEIEEQDDAVVKAGLGLEHETTTILGLLAPLTSLLSSTFSLFGSSTRLTIIVSKHGLLRLARVHLLLVRAEELSTVELVHQEPFVSFGSCILQRSEPKITSNCCQLLGQWDNLQVHHELEDEIRIGLSVVNKLED